jgi:hypothetical protein
MIIGAGTNEQTLLKESNLISTQHFALTPIRESYKINPIDKVFY